MADSDLVELRKQCITSLYLCTDNIFKYMDEEKEAEFQKLQKYAGEYCNLEAQEEVAAQALDKAKKEIDNSNLESLMDKFDGHLADLANKRLNVNNHPYMLELKKRYEKGQKTARQNLDESDLVITETMDEYIDPITKKRIQDPVKNIVCGHIYEKESIMSFINMRSRTRCPVVGCCNTNPIQTEDLMSDEELRFRLSVTQHSTMIQERPMDLDETTE